MVFFFFIYILTFDTNWKFVGIYCCGNYEDNKVVKKRPCLV